MAREIARALAVCLAVAGCLVAFGQQPASNRAAVRRAVEEIKAAKVLFAVKLDRSRAEGILDALSALGNKRRDARKWAQGQWKENGEKIKAAIAAWLAGKTPEADAQKAAQEFYQGWTQRQSELQTMAEQTAAAVWAKLGQGRSAVEGPQQAQQRWLFEQRLEGARNPAEFVQRRILALRLLMPDEYQLVRFAEAHEIATILGLRPLGAATEHLLMLMDQAVQLPPAEVEGQRFLVHIAEALGMDPRTAIPPAISWEEFVRWCNSDAALTLVSLLAGKGAPGEVRLSEEIELALDQLKLLDFIGRLQMTAQQIRAFAETAGRTFAAIKGVEQRAAAQAEQAAIDLQMRLREALQGGGEVPADVVSEVAAMVGQMESAEAEKKLILFQALLRVRRILSPQQRAMVDWTPPGEVLRALPPRQQLARLRRRAQLVAAAIDFLESVKFLQASDYTRVKIPRTRRFIEEFFPPDTPQFDRAMETALEIVRQARFIGLDEWRAGRGLEVATILLEELGLIMPPPQPAQAVGAAFTWQQVADILTGPAMRKLVGEGGQTGGQQ